MRVTFLAHDGFFIELDTLCLLFDWWKEAVPPLPDKPLLVFVSHRHEDHFNPEVFTLASRRADVQFLLGSDMTVYLVIFDRAAYQISGKLFADIAEYLDDHYVDAHTDTRRERLRGSFDLQSQPLSVYEDAAPQYASAAVNPDNLDDLLAHLDAGFSETLLKLIDRSGKKDSEIYKKANVDRKLFSKIRNNPDYKPSKSTAIAFAIALELNLDETRDLIARAGYALSASSKFDVIIEYFIGRKKYDIFEINEALFAFDQSLLGA